MFSAFHVHCMCSERLDKIHMLLMGALTSKFKI